MASRRVSRHTSVEDHSVYEQGYYANPTVPRAPATLLAGDQVEVFSHSSDGWVPATVLVQPETSKNFPCENATYVEYRNADGSRCGKTLNADTVKLRSGMRLYKAPAGHVDLLRGYFKPTQPETIGSGCDVRKREGQDRAKTYNHLEVKAAWMVSESSALMSTYLKERDRMNTKYAEEDVPRLSTLHDGVQDEMLRSGFLGENEYLLLNGLKPEHLRRTLCSGLHNKGDPTEPLGRTFGYGLYLADASDKIDQYCEVDAGLKCLVDALGEQDVQVQDLLRSQQSETDGQELCFALVVRAYMGKHIQMQIQNTEAKTEDKNAEGIIHYQDPATDLKVDRHYEQYKGCEMEHDRAPPVENFAFDSWKVMCAKSNPEFSADWADGPPNRKFPNTFPFRFCEYVLPYSQTPHAVVQYLVAYERVDLPEKPTLDTA